MSSAREQSGAAAEAMVTDGYDAVYAQGPDSPTLQRIWLEHASGPDYPAEFGHISFMTVEEADRLADASQLSSGGRLVDLACGAGGPGLLLARKTGASLTGVDPSAVGIEQATRRSERVGLADRAQFRTGSFAQTGLDDDCADAVMTIDAFQYAPNKREALAEVGRILRPGARFVFEAFEVEPGRVEGYPVIGVDPVPDYQPLLEAAGFRVNDYQETPGWLDRLTAAFSAVLDQSQSLTRELGERGYASLSLEVSITLGIMPYRRRVLGVATPG